jgi:hypothetical protein
MAMRNPAAILISPVLLALAACGTNNEGESNTADDFAARINGADPDANAPRSAPPVGQVQVAPPLTPEQASAQTLPPPVVAQPLPNPVPGTPVPSTASDANISVCGANLISDFIGKEADMDTRTAIMQAADGTAGSVRFAMPGGESVQPDPTNPRLNIMIDNLGIIRDARCG